MKRLTCFIFIGMFLTSLALAADVAYVVNEEVHAKDNVLDQIAEYELSYDIITSDDISSTDFSEYQLIVLENGRLRNVPVDEYPSIILNPDYYSGFSSSVGLITRGSAYNLNHSITEGLSGDFEGYTERQISVYYLTRKKYSTPVTLRSEDSGKGNYVISVKNDPRRVFFGFVHSDYWSEETKKMFNNSLFWVINGEDNDGDGFYSDLDCDDTNASIYPGAEEIPYNGVDEDCSGSDLTDVDKDGFDSVIVGGTDCDDNDPLVYPGSSDKSKDCSNDPPEIKDYNEEVNVFEGRDAVIVVDAYDPEDDELVYSVNDTRFKESEIFPNRFEWETGYEDAGNHSVLVNVTDGEFTVNVTVALHIYETNQPPVCEEIKDLEWPEDGMYSLNLSEYCHDNDGDEIEFYFDSTSEGEHIAIDSMNVTTGIANFSSEKDWFGEDWIRFMVHDQKDTTRTNKIGLKVLPVNDAPSFVRDISEISWEEDTTLENGINLYDYFSDVDNETLDFSVFGNEAITIDINENTGDVSFDSPDDWFGEEHVIFNATDGSLVASSNNVTLKVIDVNEAPEFMDLDCQEHIKEDKEYTCEVDATDFEGDPLDFDVREKDNLHCSFNDNVLTYSSKKDYFGDASCELIVSDEFAETKVNFEVTIENVNDAPEIEEAIPESTSVKIIVGGSRMFEIDYSDIDSTNLETIWYLDDDIVSSSDRYLFNESMGIYSLEVTVSDGELNDSKEWDVRVDDLSTFTCSEASGFVCSKDEICSSDYLGVYDNDRCCPVECNPRPPEFSEAESCSSQDLEKNASLVLDIRDPRENEDFLPGESVYVELDIENNLEEDHDFEVYLAFYDIGEDEEIEEYDDDIGLDEGEGKSIEWTFEIPTDIEEGEYAVFASMIQEDEIACNEEYLIFNIEREKDDVEIEEVNIHRPSDDCTGDIEIISDILNKGSNDQEDVYVTLKNQKLGLDYKSESFDLDEGSRNRNDYEVYFSFSPNASIEKKVYPIRATVHFDDEYKTDSEIVRLDLSGCKDKEPVEMKREPVQKNITLGLEKNDSTIVLNGDNEKSQGPSFIRKILSIIFSPFGG